MKKKKKRIKKRKVALVSVLLIVFIACIWAFVAANIITKSIKHDISSNDLEKQVVAIDSLLLTETKEGQKLWELYADKGEYESGSKIIILTNIIANFYQNGTVIASGKSTRGTYDTETKKVILYNDSCIVYKDGTSIHANLMEWEGKEKDVKAKDNVVIIKPNEYIIKSKKAVLTNNMTLFKVIGNVETRVYSKGKSGNILK